MAKSAPKINPETAAIWEKIRARFPEAGFLQSPEWGNVHRLLGHEVHLVHFADVAWCQMIERPARRGRYLEIPCGPLLDWQDREIVHRMFAAITKIARDRRCVFVRLRPELGAKNLGLLSGLHLHRAPMHLAAEHTVILDLTPSEDEILSRMRRQTRYEIRRSSKLGIEVTSGHSEELFREFQAVQAETARRQNFVPPSLEVLLAEHTALGKNATIYVARTAKATIKAISESNAPEISDLKAGQPIAYGLVITSGNGAAYYEAASTDLNRRLPGAYALQWQVIRDLKAKGITKYNLWGIAPAGKKNHRYARVTTFKTGFGGEVTEFVPAQDLIIRRFRYAMSWVFEKIRKKRRHL